MDPDELAHERTKQLAALQAAETRHIENIKGAVALAGQTVKSLEIANGGAAIAVLAFYGSITSKGVSIPFNRCALTAALICFGVGVFVAVVASMFAYHAQYAVVRSAGIRAERVWIAVAACIAVVSSLLFLTGIVLSGFAFA